MDPILISLLYYIISCTSYIFQRLNLSMTLKRSRLRLECRLRRKTIEYSTLQCIRIKLIYQTNVILSHSVIEEMVPAPIVMIVQQREFLPKRLIHYWKKKVGYIIINVLKGTDSIRIFQDSVLWPFNAGATQFNGTKEFCDFYLSIKRVRLCGFLTYPSFPRPHHFTVYIPTTYHHLHGPTNGKPQSPKRHCYRCLRMCLRNPIWITPLHQPLPNQALPISFPTLP